MSATGKFWIAGAALVMLAAACVILILTGSRLGPIEAGVVALSPLIAYFALTRPFVVPYALYAMLVPFDNVLAVSSGATLTKFIGIFSAGAILLWTIGQRRRFVAPSATLWLGAALMLWMSMSALWALNLGSSLSILPTYLGLFVLYIVLSLAPVDRQDFIIVLCAMVVGSLGAAAYGVYFFHGQSVADAQALASNFGRLTVKIGDNTIDPNAYSDAIILPFCVLLIAGLRSRFIPAKLGAAAGLVLMLGAIYVSASRGAMLAIGTAALWLVIRSRYRLQILTALVIPAVIAFLSSPLIVERFADTHRTGAAGRFGIWKVGMEAFRQHWLVGAGIGNYSAVYNSVYMRVYQAYSGGWDRVAHNLVVQVSAELGIIGLVLVLAFWFSNLFVLRHIRPSDEFYDVRLAIEAAIIGLFVASLSVDLIWFKYPWLLFSTAAQLRVLTLCSIAPVPKRKAPASELPFGTRTVQREFQTRRA